MLATIPVCRFVPGLIPKKRYANNRAILFTTNRIITYITHSRLHGSKWWYGLAVSRYIGSSRGTPILSSVPPAFFQKVK